MSWTPGNDTFRGVASGYIHPFLLMKLPLDAEEERKADLRVEAEFSVDDSKPAFSDKCSARSDQRRAQWGARTDACARAQAHRR